MKPQKLLCLASLISLSAFALASWLAAQDPAGPPHYRVIDLGTLGAQRAQGMPSTTLAGLQDSRPSPTALSSRPFGRMECKRRLERWAVRTATWPGRSRTISD